MMTFPPIVGLQHTLGRSLLAGRGTAEADRPLLDDAIAAAGATTIVFDFEGIDDVTSSYFAGLFGRFTGQEEAPTLIPILANLKPDCREDLDTALRAAHSTVWTATWKGGALSEQATLGVDLDRPFAGTLELMFQLKTATAADLFSLDRSVVMTAWSNRLALLFQMRLLRRKKDGRRVIYALPWHEVDDG